MKKNLFNKLKNELFVIFFLIQFDQKNNFKRIKKPIKEQEEKQLTK